MSGFRRLVLELGHGGADPVTMRQAAAFARLLDAELHALFVEDETLLHASALPFAREISSLSHRWRRLEPDRLEADFRAAAARAERQLFEVAGAVGIRRSFVVRRGDLALHVTETVIAGDIVVVAAPRHETTHGSHRLRETAHLSAASVLYLPPRPGPRHGPIVALATGPDDPAVAVARSIAASARERLLVGSDLGDVRERLIVMTRDDHAAPAEIARDRGVPVLVVEPG
jgi:hypothetical protein